MAQNSLAEAVPLTKEPQQRPNIAQPQPQVQPQGQPAGQLHRQKLPVSKFEKCLVLVCGLVLAGLMVCVVSAKIAMSNAQHDLQTVNQTTTTYRNRNTNTRQEINELQSRTRLDKIAQKQGLSLENARIRTVDK
ncbi:cell division protein FtsL [Levilactobacillus suantsaii]|uniref:Cell division protein FtsL n=1 Tax=Levilactobacillus suantsaii TaxID=2292255 RepID=A0A4Q0VK31_9LACO|nr:cell division protein FtsL [Levilactobacillus suantsaii]QMU07420.1 cell division protein FtsL [Levilactobacillus suantsaii]RXI79221.1 cell division protein FtsL [Levilactobacillus suantsaii]